MTGTERAQGGRHNPPVFLRIPITDHFTALLQAASVTCALFNRERTGVGEHLNLSLLRSGIFINGDAFTRYEGRPERPLPDKGQYGLGRSTVCTRHRMASGCSCWSKTTTSAGEAAQRFDAIAHRRRRPRRRRGAIGGLEERVQDTNGGRMAGRPRSSGVPSAPVVVGYDRTFWEDVQPMINGYVVRGEHPERGHMELDGNLIHFSNAPPSPRCAWDRCWVNTRAKCCAN